MSETQQPIDLKALETFTEPLLEMKAEEIVLLDLRGIAEFADYQTTVVLIRPGGHTRSFKIEELLPRLGR